VNSDRLQQRAVQFDQHASRVSTRSYSNRLWCSSEDKKNVLNIGCHKKRGEPEVRDLASALARQPLCISFSLCFLDRIEHTIRNPKLVAATPDAKEKPDSV
jgi:hypothetical protein